MSKLPTVSVVIPTRGRPELLQRAIHSVLNQTHRSLEVMVVLDGVDQVTEKFVRSIPDERVRLFVLQVGVGGAEARNIGVRNAHGKFVALLDDDDEWLPEKLEKQLHVAQASSKVQDIVVTKYIYRVQGRPDEVWPSRLPSVDEPLSEFLFSSRGGFQTSTYLCRRELFLQVPFVRGLKKHQDWDWFLQVATLPGFSLQVVAEPLSVYWVAERSRCSVSGSQDWKFSQDWALNRLPLMTRRAYSKFLVKICTRSAVAQQAGLRALASLLKEIVVRGHTTPLLLIEFAACLLVPDQVRLCLRYLVEPVRRSLSFTGNTH